MQHKTFSELQQPLLQGQINTQTQVDDTKSKSLLPLEYQWILDKHNETDYSKVENRIKNIPFKLNKDGISYTVVQLIMILHRNQLMLEYYYNHDVKDRYVDFVDFKTLQSEKTVLMKGVFEKSKVFHSLYNDVDYIFYQEDHYIYIVKLEDFDRKKQDLYLIELQFDMKTEFHNATIIDKFSILISYGQSPSVGNFYQFYNQDYSHQSYQISGYIIFNQTKQYQQQQASILVDKKSLQIVRKVDKHTYAIKHLELYEYVFDSDFNIYDSNYHEGQAPKQLQKLYHSGIEWMYKIATTSNKFIIFCGNRTCITQTKMK
ncbi:UNKNOWN [Stylonychia lemnae]|uniref:Uncharacterized protein n=1 Tax=Stylonychia lemnae TaxID=5949 RepID=A0A078AV79_STYLE|nr:UNKNOWN [Stylonychia lemnae]|eukprot:CDW85177.1 UNKNOWN [Stylonychia lemnae]